jgi:NADH dehydrogenase
MGYLWIYSAERIAMAEKEVHVVTGAFGFAGKYIARRLLEAGFEVRTVTNSQRRENPFEGRVKAYPFNFNDPERLVESLRGARVLYNTYWVRFNTANFSFSLAVDNTMKLFDAAGKAGIRRIVHISILNASESSAFEYVKDKAIVERLLKESGLSYAILRPAVLFGKEDILINNIAWVLRRLPAFGVFGDGNYRLQPIYVDDLAALAVEQGRSRENVVINAIGPETFTYRELVTAIGQRIGKERPIVSVPPWFGYAVGRLLGKFVGDVVITKDEIEGLMADLLYVDAPPAGHTVLTEWVKAHAGTLGRRYTSELARRKDQVSAYRSN